MEATKPKWVNSILNINAVNSLRLEGLQITVTPLFPITSLSRNIYQKIVCKIKNPFIDKYVKILLSIDIELISHMSILFLRILHNLCKEKEWKAFV